MDILAPKLAEIAEALRAELISDDLDKQRRVLREVIECINVRREDAEIKVVIHYCPIQAKAPPGLGGANLVKGSGGPDGIRTRDLGLDRAAC